MSITNDYGKENWEILWKKIEQEWNIGIDYIINPYLYAEIAFLLNNRPHSRIVDFWAGTNILGLQLCYWYQWAIPWLKIIPNLQKIRKNIDVFIGLEWSVDLVEKWKSYLKDIWSPNNIDITHFEIKLNNKSLFKDNSMNLAVSRNFIMHLSIEDLEYHFQEVSRILEHDWSYIFAMLNPAYENRKYQDQNPGETWLRKDGKYSFLHGKAGEYGTFYHYWREQGDYEKVFSKYFDIESKTDCIPITNEFKETHSRYYIEGIPMAFVYNLRKK